MPKVATKQDERKEAADRLRELCPPGTQVYCILRHVSRSGMQRRISLYVKVPEGDGMQWLDGYVSATGLARRHHGSQDALVVNGCGMDMGFHLVYELARTLYPDGYGCIGEGCPSNDHANGDRNYRPHDASNAHHWHWHRDGGYALRHRWL